MSKPRLQPLKPETLDPQQRKLYDDVLKSPRAQGPMGKLLVRNDGSLVGPFDAWMRSPVLGSLFERAGMALRTDTSVSDAAREVAICVVARAWNADFEWWVHGRVALAAGVPQSVLDAIAARRAPAIDDREVVAAHDIAVELVYKRGLDTATLERAKAELGERGLVEIVMAVGFYQLVSGTLESFHPPGPSGNLVVEGPPVQAQAAGFDLYHAASTTRAVRRLRPDPVPDAVLHRVVQAATWAPSGANQEPWRIVAVRAPELKQGLARLNKDLWYSYVDASRARLAQLPEQVRLTAERTIDAGNYLADHLDQAPVINVFCFDSSRLQYTDSGLDRPSVVGGASLYPAVQNFLLACRAEGLGCVLTTLLCSREAQVRDLLGIPEPWGTFAFVPIGWPLRGGHGPLSRRPVEAVVDADQFGNRLFAAESEAEAPN